MSTDTKEKGLEQHITDALVSANGYVLRTSQDYDNVNCGAEHVNENETPKKNRQ